MFSVKGILNEMAPLFRLVVREALELALREGLKKDNMKTHIAVGMASFYPVLDVQLETLVDETGKAIPMAVVDGIKDAIENVATENGIVLSNLDED